MGRGVAEIGVDVSVAVDQENVGVVGRRGGADSDVGARYRDGSQLPSKTSGKTERRREKERKSQLKQSETTAGGVNNESNYLVGPICAKAVVATASNPDESE